MSKGAVPAAPAAPSVPSPVVDPKAVEAAVDQPIEEVVADESDKKDDKVETKPVSIKMLKKLKLKFKEKEYEEDLPFEIPDTPEAVEYMRNQLQMSKLGHTSAQEKAQLQKELGEFIDAIRTNPRAILSDPTLGVDLKKLAAEILQEEIENSKKSPEQLEKEKIEKELKNLKEQYEKEKKDSRDRDFERLKKQSLDNYNNQIDAALKNSTMPKSPYVVKKIADYMLLGLKEGHDLSVQDVLPLVEEEIQNDVQAMFSSMPEEVVQKIIGKEKLNNIRKKTVAKAKEAPPAPLSKSVKDTGGKVEPKKEEKRQTYKDFFKM